MNTIVLIGMPNGSGSIPAVMVSSLLQLRKPCPCAFMVVERQMIEMARNGICAEGIRNNVSHVLMVDDDNPIPPETLEIMLADDKDVVIAPILSRNPKKDGTHDLCAFYRHEIGGVNLYWNVVNFRDSGHLHKIDAGGTGCMLIKIDVLKKLNEIYKDKIFERTHTYFDKPITVNSVEYKERTMSEDVEFCERAVKAGFEIWLDERIRPLHITGNNMIQWRNGK